MIESGGPDLMPECPSLVNSPSKSLRGRPSGSFTRRNSLTKTISSRMQARLESKRIQEVEDQASALKRRLTTLQKQCRHHQREKINHHNTTAAMKKMSIDMELAKQDLENS